MWEGKRLFLWCISFVQVHLSVRVTSLPPVSQPASSLPSRAGAETSTGQTGFQSGQNSWHLWSVFFFLWLYFTITVLYLSALQRCMHLELCFYFTLHVLSFSLFSRLVVHKFPCTLLSLCFTSDVFDYPWALLSICFTSILLHYTWRVHQKWFVHVKNIWLKLWIRFSSKWKQSSYY